MNADIESFLNSLRIQTRSPLTIRAYGDELVSSGADASWTVPQIEAYLASRLAKDKPATIGRRIASLRSFFAYLELSGKRADNPMRRVQWKPSRVRKLPRYLEEEDIKKMLAVPCRMDATVRSQLLLEVLWWTGCRISEIMGLTVDKLGVGSLTVYGKGAKERTVPCGQGVIDRLRAQANAEGKVFTYSKSTARLDLKRLARAAGVEGRITPHLIRHSLATALLEGGKFSIREVQEWLGHASLTTTQIYTHVKAAALSSKALVSHPAAKA